MVKKTIMDLHRENKKLISILEAINYILLKWHKDEYNDFEAMERIWEKSLIDERIIYTIKKLK